ncbi:hypothetical protein YTPLAS72_35750 [Nitrospira sp.]|nr:hypothetical protein YTPLAS72_35750 [Nitrospira sp.]
MGQAIHSDLRIAGAQCAYVITLPTQSRQDALVPKLRVGFETILNGSQKVFLDHVNCGIKHPRGNTSLSMNQARTAS